MSPYSSASRVPTSDLKRERMLSMTGAALGVLMFVWGFLKWLNAGAGDSEREYAGFAFGMPTTVVIGLSLAAGLIALLAASEHRAGRGVHGAVPAGLAASSFLVAVGILIGKGSISPDAGDTVGVEIGLLLALITAGLQTVVLGISLASYRADHGAAADSDSYPQPLAR